MERVRSFVLCADDFGLSEAIDRGIVTLIEAGRISATGCMVTGPAFAADAPKLAGLADRVDVGLHFALTDLAPVAPITGLEPAGGPQTLKRVLARALALRIDPEEIVAEIARQVDRFRDAFGRDPDFFDGHQHVQVFPGVRRAVFAAFDRGILDARHTWVRDSGDRVGRIVGRGVETAKSLFIAALSIGFADAARMRGIVVNDGFAGITAFDPARYGELFPNFLEKLGDRPLVMCHPADPDGPVDPTDPIDRARRAEFAYLSGDDFAALVERRRLVPARMGATG